MKSNLRRIWTTLVFGRALGTSKVLHRGAVIIVLDGAKSFREQGKTSQEFATYIRISRDACD
jgi:hypothetical protein